MLFGKFVLWKIFINSVLFMVDCLVGFIIIVFLVVSVVVVILYRMVIGKF